MSTIALADRLAGFLRGKWTGRKRVQGLQGGARAFVLFLFSQRRDVWRGGGDLFADDLFQHPNPAFHGAGSVGE